MAKIIIRDGISPGMRIPGAEVGTYQNAIGSPVLNEDWAKQFYGLAKTKPISIPARFVKYFQSNPDNRPASRSDFQPYMVSEMRVMSGRENIARAANVVAWDSGYMRPASNMFDGNPTTEAFDPSVTFDFGSTFDFEALEFDQMYSQNNRSLHRVLTSLDGSTWTPLNKDFSNPTDAAGVFSMVPRSGSIGAFRYWRLSNVSAIYYFGLPATLYQPPVLAQPTVLQMFETALTDLASHRSHGADPVDDVARSATITNSSGVTSPEKLFDGYAGQDYAPGNFANQQAFVEFDLGTARSVKSVCANFGYPVATMRLEARTDPANPWVEVFSFETKGGGIAVVNANVQ